MSTEDSAVTRSEISGGDFDEARSLLQNEYHGTDFRVEPTGTDFIYRYSSIGDDQLTLRGNLFGGSIKGTIQTEGEYIVSWITAGAGATDLTEDTVTLVHGQPAMFTNNRPAAFDFQDHRQNLMHFDADFLESVAAEHEGITGPLLFDTRSRPTGNALRTWASTVSAVARVHYDATTSVLLRREANRTAAIALLDTFPHIALASSTELSLPSHAKLRAAIEHMHAHAHLPLPTEDIAQAVGLSLRSLQALFRRELDTTPLDYLRRIRLDRVRDDLRAGDTRTTTVTEVAQRWGFAHLGRFSASYTHRFGEYPRTTLDT